MGYDRDLHPMEAEFHGRGFEASPSLTATAVGLAHNIKCAGDFPLVHQGRTPVTAMIGGYILRSTIRDTRKAVVINRHNGDYVEFSVQTPYYVSSKDGFSLAELEDALKSLAALAMFGKEDA